MPTPTSTRRRNITTAAVALGAVLALAACSSSSSSPTTTAARSGGNQNNQNQNNQNQNNQNQNNQNQNNQNQNQNGGSTASRLSGVENSLRNGQGAVFKATYSANYNGTQTTMTIAQDPPKSSFAINQALIVDTGSATYYCPSGSTPTCVNSSQGNPVASLTAAFSPKQALSQIDSARAALSSRIAGYDVSVSSATFAGQPSTCVRTTVNSATWKYCVTDKGMLAYASSGPQQVFQMTSYTNTVSPADVSLPSGATVVTIPTS